MVKTKFISLIAFCTVLVTSSLAQNFSLLPVTVDGKVGYIDTTGTLVIEPKFDFGNYFDDNNRATVEYKGSSYMIDTSGMFICEPFEEMGYFPHPYHNGNRQWVNAKKDGKWGYLNENFEEVLPFAYDEAEAFKEGIAIVKTGKIYGYLSHDGEYHELGELDYVYRIGEGLLKLSKDYDKEAVYNFELDSLIVNFGNYNVKEAKNERLVLYDSKILTDKVLDLKGNTLLLPKRHLHIQLSQDSDLLMVQDTDNDKFGIMDLSGKWILKPKLKYDMVYQLEHCGDKLFASFKVDRGGNLPVYGAINEEGKVVIEPNYRYLIFGKEFIFFTPDGEITEGIMDNDLNIILPNQEYTNVYFITDEIMGLEVGEYTDANYRNGYMNIKTKKVIWEP